MSDPLSPTNRPTDQPSRSVAGRWADWLGAAFYVTVAAVALAGQTDAAVGWLHWPVATALPAVGALELGGIALAARADFRRRLGERAVAARLLSAAVAVFAVLFNWAGHTNHLAGGFFAGMSALGYCVWLIQAGDRRRDQLRAAGMLADVTPSYPVAQWLRHPWTTRQARHLAAADPGLGLYGSLAAATLAVRTERRQAAISKILHQRIRASADPVTAEIAVTVFDLDEIARRLADRANYDGLTDLIAVGLDPDRLLTRPTEPIPAKATKPKAIDRPAKPLADQPKRTPKPTDQKTTDRPAPEPTNHRADGRADLRLVGHSAAAVANAGHLRKLYGDQLPDSGQQIRKKTGWSYERLTPAVEAYRAGADRGSSDDSERVLVGATA